MHFEKTQRRNPHKLTVRQHVHSVACIERFTNKDGMVAVLRVGTSNVFRARPDNDIFVARRAWSHGLEHGLFFKVETRFQEAVAEVLDSCGEPDHEAVTDYLIIWSLRAHLDEMSRDPLPLVGVSASGLSLDQEEMLESKGAGFVRDGGMLPAHISRWMMVMPFYDASREQLKRIRWRLGRAPDGRHLMCADAFRGASAPAIPLDSSWALVASKEGGPADEMTADVVDRINTAVFTNARRCVFGHPDMLPASIAAIPDARSCDPADRVRR